MNDIVIVALISLAGTGLGTFGGILTSNKLVNYRIDQLEKKVDKHNSVIDRTYKLEEEVAIIKTKLEDEV